MKTLFFIAALIMSAPVFIGCETTRGAGEDIENTGENIQEGVRDATE